MEAADAAIGYWSMVNDAMKRLSDKDMTKQPYDQSNSVACLLWHMNRIVDNMTHARLQSQRQLWVLEGWHQKSAWAGPADGCGSSLEGSSGQARGRLPMSETPLHFKTISELATLIKAKALSPVEVTEAMLTRIQEQDSQYKSYATVMGEQARASAQAAERAIAAGNYLGSLHGVPIAVKDLCFTKGVATMGATKALMGHVPDFDSTVVQKLNAAGAIILGKLNLTEGAMAGYNPEFQVPVNPWGANLWSGASSSGSGVATSAGLCYGSLGSDTGGSIRFPSAACGIVGIKPTWGRVSRYGVLALAESLDHIGPMTRSAADAGIMLQAIAGLDPNDPTSLPAPVPDMLEGIDQGVRGLRIGLDEEYISGNTDPRLVESVLAGIRMLEGLGAVVVPIQMPDTSDYMEAWVVLCAAEAVAAHEATYPSRREDYGPWFQAWLDMGAAVTGAEYAKANNVRSACHGLLNNVFENIDAIGCPTMTTPPLLWRKCTGRRFYRTSPIGVDSRCPSISAALLPYPCLVARPATDCPSASSSWGSTFPSRCSADWGIHLSRTPSGTTFGQTLSEITKPKDTTNESSQDDIRAPLLLPWRNHRPYRPRRALPVALNSWCVTKSRTRKLAQIVFEVIRRFGASAFRQAEG